MTDNFKVLFYLKRAKHKVQPVIPVMGRITVNGTIAQFSAKLSVPSHLWEMKDGRAKGKSLEANCRATDTVFHASLNPLPEDKLTDEQLKEIVLEKLLLIPTSVVFIMYGLYGIYNQTIMLNMHLVP